MPDKFGLSLLMLPVELVYRILDHLDELTIVCSMRNVCIHMNTIVDTYYRYQVNSSLFQTFSSVRSIKYNKLLSHI
jgi:hypothetical protein